jgi:hypothetical protein
MASKNKTLDFRPVNTALPEDRPTLRDDGRDVDGFDEPLELDMSGYPLDSMLIRSEPRTVHDVFRRIEQCNYIMNPDFQRDFIWSPDKQSRLVESLLMRIPLPVFYLAERHDGRVVVIDGLQRLTTIALYMQNKFSLRHLDDGNQMFRGKAFCDLPPKLQNRIEDTQLILYILDEKVPELARLDIFERVNSGEPLSRQHMRNCIYMGQATRLLAELAKEGDFLTATDRRLNWRTMRDREMINRFMAFHLLGLKNYRGNMDQFLADALKLMNALPKEDLLRLKRSFLLSMRNNYHIWGEHAFRKHHPQQQGKNVINAAMFDVLSVLFSRVSEENAQQFAARSREILFNLQENASFASAISQSTNNQPQVETRFALAEKSFQEVL